ncbi:ybbR-like family protein [[Clostridium] bifermentans ATCC 19299]|uniref:CdaR family protein n=1 Tax=Paraclostridium bifermentans TaxID=1490 RepID=UPI00038D3554|nr:CdaR family protein [Paraclostridium bifermentans]EQK48633.1 ybbR-like family protein [[Clostridium] bifermentans ATCC 19299] [Paraclostridium bifermentans ATCC 19299]
MKNRLKNNTKIKLISLLSALVLWLYVMTVEDPVETRTFSDIPVTITNMSVLEERGLTIYPKEELLADISIRANLSSLRPINRDNIYIYGRLDDPKEGKNVVYLQANLPERVNKYDIKPNVITLDLEKVVNEKRSISVDVEGEPKINIDNIDTNKKTVDVSGPRTLVNKVTSIKATLDASDKYKDFSTKLKLVPVDANGDAVKGVKLDDNFVVATVKFLQEKVVPVKLVFDDSVSDQSNLENYSINPKDITIEGKKEALDNINGINTKPITANDLKSNNSIDVALDIPKDVKIKNNISSIKLNINKNITSEFLISKSDIEIVSKESETGKEVDLSKIPENIKITVSYSDEIKDLSQKDIQLYIDMADTSQGEGKYPIKYKSKYDFKDVQIEPKIVEI